jgi:hypothetical protein
VAESSVALPPVTGEERIMSIHSHSYSSSLPLGRGRPLKTAKDYRAMAEECVKWAREARDDDVRAPLLQLAQTWLDAASKLDGLPANP